MSYDRLYGLVDEAYRDMDTVELTVLDPGGTAGLVMADWHRDDRTIYIQSTSLPRGLMALRLGEILRVRHTGIFICENMPPADPMHDHMINRLTHFAAELVETVIAVNPTMWKPWYRKMVISKTKNPYEHMGKLHRLTVNLEEPEKRADRHQKDAIGLTLWFVVNFLAHTTQGVRDN